MKEVTKEEFKNIYFKYGLAKDGWGKEYWDKHYENPEKQDMKYKVRLPASNLENRMMIVDDFSTNEHRLFFVSVDQEEAFFDNPGKS